MHTFEPASWAELDEDDDEIDPLTYHRARADQVAYQLRTNPPADPELRARLERDLEHWQRQVDAATVHEHWSSGEGDRRLF